MELKMKEKTKEQHIQELINSISAVEQKIADYKDHLKDLKKSYVENGHLTKEEIKAVLKAYQLHKAQVDFDLIAEVHGTLEKRSQQ
tara:strand:- start:214 stop:471 length:258 start_codon:yes stop_codon:yes gene_type:complete